MRSSAEAPLVSHLRLDSYCYRSLVLLLGSREGLYRHADYCVSCEYKLNNPRCSDLWVYFTAHNRSFYGR